MPRVTKADLEKKVQDLYKLIDRHLQENIRLDEKIKEMEKAENVVRREDYEHLVTQYEELQLMYESTKKLLQKEKKKTATLRDDLSKMVIWKDQLLEEVHKLKNDLQETKRKVRNPKGSGRKPKLTEEQKQKMWELYQTGKSMDALKEMFGVSKGCTYNAIKEMRKKCSEIKK